MGRKTNCSFLLFLLNQSGARASWRGRFLAAGSMLGVSLNARNVTDCLLNLTLTQNVIGFVEEGGTLSAPLCTGLLWK